MVRFPGTFCYRRTGRDFQTPTNRSTERCVMLTDRQIEANRQNAQHSTGPRTPEGRAAVRLNGLKHGLCAETVVVPGEDPAAFEAMLDGYRAEYQPATPQCGIPGPPGRHGRLAPVAAAPYRSLLPHHPPQRART